MQKFLEEQKDISNSDKLPNAKSKHIAKAAQAYATTKALSKSLLCRPKRKTKKIPRFAKIKSADTPSPTDKDERKKNHCL